MSNLFNDLLASTAEDGASAPVGVLSGCHGAEMEELMYAWMHERRESIENGMFLDCAHKLLRRILIDGQLTPRTQRKAMRLLQAIKANHRVNGHP